MTNRYTPDFHDPRGTFGQAPLKREGAVTDTVTGREVTGDELLEHQRMASRRSTRPRKKPKPLTVAALMAELKKYPPKMKVALVYDSQVMCAEVTFVAKWQPNAFYDEASSKGETFVGMFDEAPDDPADERLA